MKVLPLLGLDGITLLAGSHPDREAGVDAMEAVAWLAGEAHSDMPKCASPVLGAFMRSWNDALDDEGRQKLKPYLPRLIGTAGNKKKDEKRAWLCTDWLVRECAPAWLELAGVKEAPAALRALPPILSVTAAKKAQPTVDDARQKGTVAREAAWDAAREAAWSAAGAAARDAAGAAAGEAARAAVW